MPLTIGEQIWAEAVEQVGVPQLWEDPQSLILPSCAQGTASGHSEENQ